ncbi:hypothetical protein CUROG_08060 [Corynebacterium urogenitale]|uniref:Uncharacterized protein n=1 Tax=Corynebacterium urogenitale TaxID=2487892 RepID=A0A5J6ZDI7_9CORY|nr:hypothetical protein CUROG_08060 [Corynebacterium urogenitale]
MLTSRPLHPRHVSFVVKKSPCRRDTTPLGATYHVLLHGGTFAPYVEGKTNILRRRAVDLNLTISPRDSSTNHLYREPLAGDRRCTQEA